MQGQSEIVLSPGDKGEEDEQLDEAESLERDGEDGDGGGERADDGVRHCYRKGRCGYGEGEWRKEGNQREEL